MCWSLEASLATGTATYLTAAYLVRRNVRWDRANALFLLAVGAVQWLEALLWLDGMRVQRGGSCSAVNWAVSTVAIPVVVRMQAVLRHMELRFRLLSTSITALLCAALLGHTAFFGTPAPAATLAPEAWVCYLRHCGCAVASQLEGNSPLWCGQAMPMFGWLWYGVLVTPPLFASGRSREVLLGVLSLSAGLAFPDSWPSKFCSFSNLLSLWYLLYSGPRLLPAAAAPRLQCGCSGEVVLNFNLKLNLKMDMEQQAHQQPWWLKLWCPLGRALRAHEAFCFATARP